MESSLNPIINLLSCQNLPLDHIGLHKLYDMIVYFQSNEQLKARYAFAISSNKSIIAPQKTAFSSFVSCGFRSKIKEKEDIKENLIELDVVKRTDFNEKGVLTKNASAIILHRIFTEFDDVKPIVSGNVFHIPSEHSVIFLEKFKKYKSIQWSSIQKDTGFNLNYDSLTLGRDVWDWKSISTDKRIRWDEYMITEFIDLIDWAYFSSNDNFKWDKWFIDKYSERINFKALSSNKSLAMNSELYFRYKDKWNLEALAKNPGVLWTEELVLYVFPELMDKDVKLYERSLEVTLLGNARLHFDVLSSIEYHMDAFDRTVEFHHSVRRNSDGYHDYTNTYSLWDVLCSNPKIKWPVYHFNKYFPHLNLRALRGKITLTTDMIQKYWDYIIPFTYSSQENYDGYREEIESVRFVEYFKDCEIVDITFEKFLANEIKWWGTFNSEKFLNPSITKVLSNHLSSNSE